MLKQHSRFFESLLLLVDWITLSISWMLAYHLRFYAGIIPVHKGIPSFTVYLILLIFMIPLWGMVFRFFGLYRPRRISTWISEVLDIAKASSAATLLLIALTYLFQQYEFSRLAFFCFWLINITFLSLTRILFREFLRILRLRGYNQRYALIIGTDKMGQDLVNKLRKHPDLGIQVVGFLTDDTQDVGKEIHGIKVVGRYPDVRNLIVECGVDMVFIALSFQFHYQIKDILNWIGDEMVNIIVLPDLFEFVTLRGSVSELEGMPLISLRDTPLYGWNLVVKRVSDVVCALSILTFAAPVMLAVALLVRFTSRGPVLFRQERMGLDGKVFTMLKFRTMPVNAEEITGPVWTKEDDPRRTKIGKFLRKTSLDELPQFFNVLKGDMSIVGPRPERPVFIQNFRDTIPKYMLRHKMKAGITGWAQVNGWRGNTSLEKRIECDLHYIENWSLSLDIKIIWLTVWRGFVNKHAY